MQEEKMKEKSLEVTNYEANLKLHYEAKRKELDILLTSSMPTQLSTIKTLLWMNIVMIGLMMQIFRSIPLTTIAKGFFLLSIVSICITLAAMLIKRVKSYGVIDDIEYASKLHDNEWTVSKGLADMLSAAHNSIMDNRDVIVQRAKLMHIATWITLFSILFLCLSVWFRPIQNEDIQMADEKTQKPIPSPITPEVGKLHENSVKRPQEAPKPKPSEQKK
ncbi:MAG: hypothetical protein CJD30_03675 [Sulfuricurvum sp. PD_MW2]|uniref:hypothetical protein n=1 Tax=Sulfuricurvum sp. PD_MW2 TaxID=2027917 RepID=UPI000C060F86|nr:hypothetical protein [Sulfuricurvum sp. PD_MW2]PHM18072.1 MAG: hypothetical protein CJD30_03675 [Sulfuricurvum sp. PD_MW2]